MAFGQASGPPAGGRQIDELAGLFERAGYASFKEARHPFGLTQRQAGGKFTVGEAQELIERLQAAEVVHLAEPAADVAPEPDLGTTGRQVQPATGAPVRSAASREAARARASRQRSTISSLRDDVLVAELERRGWCCIPPVETMDDAAP